LNYHPGMSRSPIALTAAVVLTLSGTAAVANAEPSAPPCSYRLSPPQVVQLSGTNVVTTTLSPAGWRPRSGVKGAWHGLRWFALVILCDGCGIGWQYASFVVLLRITLRQLGWRVVQAAAQVGQ